MFLHWTSTTEPVTVGRHWPEIWCGCAWISVGTQAALQQDIAVQQTGSRQAGKPQDG